MSETPSQRPGVRRRLSPLRVVLGLLILVLLLANLIRLPPRTPSSAYIVTCKVNLHLLHRALDLYAQEHGNLYPTPAKWCDLTVAKCDQDTDPKALLQCPRDWKATCSYAMNPHADPCGAGDVVLLFESKAGWNQFGGAELLTMENHEGQGGNVLFVDGSIRFVKPDEIAGLKWTDEKDPRSELRNARSSLE